MDAACTETESYFRTAPPQRYDLPIQSPTEKHLTHLSKTVVTLLNARCYDHPWFRQYVSPDVRVDLQGQITIGLGGFVGNYKHDSADSGRFQVKIGNVTAVVDEKRNEATVILSQHLSGYQSDERKMAGTMLLCWNRIKGQWINVSVTMLLGTPEFLV